MDILVGVLLIVICGCGWALDTEQKRLQAKLDVLLKRIPIREPTEIEIDRAMTEDWDYVTPWRAQRERIPHADAINEIVRQRVLTRFRDEQRAR